MLSLSLHREYFLHQLAVYSVFFTATDLLESISRETPPDAHIRAPERARASIQPPETGRETEEELRSARDQEDRAGEEREQGCQVAMEERCICVAIE
jgi:hypothetical protein